MTMWMAISNDELESTIAVGSCAGELADTLGIKTSSVYEKLSRDNKKNYPRKRLKYKIVKIRVDEEGEE